MLQQNTAVQTFYKALGGGRVGDGVTEPPDGRMAPTFRYARPDPPRFLSPSGGVSRQLMAHQNVF